MRGTLVDTLPGGLLDLLRRLDSDRPGVGERASGRANAAVRLLQPHAGTEPPPVQAAWLYLARHTALLTLPDGGALPYDDPLDRRPPWPRQPQLPDPSEPAYGVCWALVQLGGGLRDLRGMLPPLATAEISPAARLLQWGSTVLDGARTRLVPGWPALAGHLDLLTADLAARAGALELASSRLAAARAEFARLGDERALAAVALVAGDWQAAPFASPLTFGLSLGTPTSQDSSLPDSTEGGEQQAPADPGGARAAYAEAESRYAAAGDARGLAHVAWRRAYLAHAGGRPDESADLAVAATLALRQAGDEAGALTAGAHAVLAGLADGRLPVPEEVAAPILAWALGPGSLSQAIGVGRMFARTGRRWASAGTRRCELALAATAIARSIWAGLDRPASRSQAFADEAGALITLGARQAALLALQSATDTAATAPPPAPDSLIGSWTRQAILAAELYNLANAAGDVEAMGRAQARLKQVTEPLRAPARPLAPDEAAIAEQLLGLVATIDQRVIGLIYQAQSARDDGRTARADELFAQAEAALEGAEPESAGQFLAILRAFQLRFPEAAALYRPWLADRLAEIEAARPQATSGPAATILRQAERQLRDQALMFSVRSDDLATARAQLAALSAQADPWWAGLGTAWEHEDVLGRLLEADGDLDGAAAAFGRAVAAVEGVRADLRRDDLRLAFGADRLVQQVYRNAARIELRRRGLAGPGSAAGRAHGSAAVRQLELGRSRALMDLLATPDPGLAPDVVRAWRGAEAETALGRDRLAAALATDPPDPTRVAAGRAALRQSEAVLAQRIAQLRALNPRFWQLAGPGQPAQQPLAEVDQLCAALPAGHAVLLYSIDRPDLVACGLSAAGLVAAAWSRQERRIGNLASRFVQACADGGDWQAHAGELAAILLDPLAGAIEGATCLHIVASGATLAIPFAALPWRGRPLGEQVALSVLPSLSAYPLLGPGAAAGQALCVGDPAAMSYRPAPEGPGVDLPALPGTALEARAVARVYRVEPLIGPAATERAVRDLLPRAPLVHLATHGLLDPVSPLASSVMLADGEQLTVAELLSLHLDADLVVLSACQTGTGRSTGGDELLGLGRALIAAGARAALVSLWPVDDEATAVLMARFHALRAQHAPTGEALRQATGWLRGLTSEQVHAQYALLSVDLLSVDLLSDPLVEAGTARAEPAPARAISPARPEAAPRSPDCSPAHPNRWAPFVLIGR